MQLLGKFSHTILLVFLLFLIGCAENNGLQSESDEGSLENWEPGDS